MIFPAPNTCGLPDKFTLWDLNDHINMLCMSRSISFLSRRRRLNRAYAYYPATIAIPPIRSTLSYAIALHEIGHIHTQWRAGFIYPMFPREVIRLNAEVLAWAWAKEAALVWTHAMHLTHKCFLGSHLNARRRWAQRGLM